MKDWKKEVARDLLALGSIPFFLIVLARSLIGQYLPFVYELVIAGVILLILWKILPSANQHIARSFILLVFTALFYQHLGFGIAATVLWGAIVFGAWYLKIGKQDIIKGVIAGILISGISYYLTTLLI